MTITTGTPRNDNPGTVPPWIQYPDVPHTWNEVLQVPKPPQEKPQ